MKHRFAALVIVSLPAAWFVGLTDVHTLKKLDSMTASEYVERARHIHQGSFFLHFLTIAFFGGLFLLSIELVAYAICRVSQRPTTGTA